MCIKHHHEVYKKMRVLVSLKGTHRGKRILFRVRFFFGMDKCTSGGGLEELPKDEMLAPSRPVVNPSISHSDVSESLSRDVVLGGDK